jgi:hypothetical protein
LIKRELLQKIIFSQLPKKSHEVYGIEKFVSFLIIIQKIPQPNEYKPQNITTFVQALVYYYLPI